MRDFYVVKLSGTPRMNGSPVTNMKSVEMAYLFSKSVSGTPVVAKHIIYEQLYGNYHSRNAAWYPVRGCREKGIPVEYDRATECYFVDKPVVSDLVLVYDCLREGSVDKALFFLGGPVLPGVNDDFSNRLRAELERAFDNALIDSSNSQRAHVKECLEYRRVM